MKKITRPGFAALFIGTLALGLQAAEPAGTNAPAATNQFTLAKIPDAAHEPVIITNTVTIGGERVTYTAETGMLPILKPEGVSRASVFYVAYTRQDVKNHATRPVTFCFNGGPGSASVWLHLGALGPRRAKMNADGSEPAPPFTLVDNEYSLLDNSDLVFIDPVATGFSRAAKDEKADQFFGNEADLSCIGEFIRLWTTRHERWLLAEIPVAARATAMFPGGGPAGGSACTPTRTLSERAGAGLEMLDVHDDQRRNRGETVCR